MKRLIPKTTTFVAAVCPIPGAAFADDAPSPEEWYKRFDYFTGVWTSDLKTDGKVRRWKLTNKWSSTRRCHILTVTVDGKPYEQGLYGYDPKLKCWRGTVFWANGRLTTELYRLDALKALKAKSGEYAGESFGTNIDGSKYKETGTFAILDENTFSMKFVTEDGHIDDGVFKRQRKKP